MLLYKKHSICIKTFRSKKLINYFSYIILISKVKLFNQLSNFLKGGAKINSNKITNANIVAAFNKLKTRPYLATKDLLPSKSYKVLAMFRHKNKYGNVVIAELEEGMLYLPKR